MTPTDDDRRRLAYAVQRRITDLRLNGSKRELEKRSGVAQQTWKKLLDGEPVRGDAAQRMELTLGGPPGVFDDVLAGRTAEWGDAPLSTEERLDRLERQVNLVLDRLDQMGTPQDERQNAEG